MIEKFSITILLISALITYALANIYKVIFLNNNKKNYVPTGFGVTLPIILIIIIPFLKFYPLNIYKSIFIIIIGGLIYLIDD